MASLHSRNNTEKLPLLRTAKAGRKRDACESRQNARCRTQRQSPRADCESRQIARKCGNSRNSGCSLAVVWARNMCVIVMCFVLCWCVLVRAPCCSGYAPLCLTTDAPRWRAPCSAPPMRMRRGRLILITRAPLQCPVDVRKKPDVVPVQFFYFMYLSLRGDACSDRCP